MIKIRCEFNVATTLDRLEEILKEKAITIIARIDHAAAAQKVDLTLRPTQVLFFGNPKLGTPIMQSQQTAGLDLPMRMLAWQEEDGSCYLAYHSPQKIAEQHNVTEASDAVAMLTNALTKVAEYAAGV